MYGQITTGPDLKQLSNSRAE